MITTPAFAGQRYAVLGLARDARGNSWSRSQSVLRSKSDVKVVESDPSIARVHGVERFPNGCEVVWIGVQRSPFVKNLLWRWTSFRRLELVDYKLVERFKFVSNKSAHGTAPDEFTTGIGFGSLFVFVDLSTGDDLLLLVAGDDFVVAGLESV